MHRLTQRKENAMKKYLIPNEGKFYKTALHTHTTVSDGKLTPEELKEEYKKRGFSVVAYTDHEVVVPHNDLRDEDFLPITAYEISVTDGKWTPFTKCYHMNLYFRDKDTVLSKTFCEKKVSQKEHMQALITDEMRKVGTESRDYTKQFVQWLVDTAREEGAIVSYNHPVWSLQSKDDYSGIKGFFGVEWHNTGCVRVGMPDSIKPIEDLIAEGERKCYPLATDDCHGLQDVGGGWVMVKARELEYETVFNALEKGEFYSTNGPEIKELYVEDGTLTVKTSPVKKIAATTGHRPTMRKNAPEGELITEASFSLEGFTTNVANAPEGVCPYVRIDLTDEYGGRAYSRTYFADEFLDVEEIRKNANN